MPTSGEAVTEHVLNVTCHVCGWDGAVDASVDEDDSVLFTCPNGHDTHTTWGEVT